MATMTAAQRKAFRARVAGDTGDAPGKVEGAVEKFTAPTPPPVPPVPKQAQPHLLTAGKSSLGGDNRLGEMGKAAQEDFSGPTIRGGTATGRKEHVPEHLQGGVGPPPKRPGNVGNLRGATPQDEDYIEEGGGRGIPRPGRPHLPAAATSPRSRRPPNYKVHVLTALSLSLLIRLAKYGTKAVTG